MDEKRRGASGKLKTCSVLMPLRLGKDVYYNPRGKCYCAAGYLFRHLYGGMPGGTDLAGGVYIPDCMREDFPRLGDRDLFSDIFSRNDTAPTQAARLQEFRKTCEILGIEIIERRAAARGHGETSEATDAES